MKTRLNANLYFTILIGIFLLISCAVQPSKVTSAIPNGEGKVHVDGGDLWYKVSGNASGLPIVLLHGGPGYSSYYLKPLEKLGQNRQVIRYDQLGSGKSDLTTDTSLFTIDHFVEQLETLRKHLNVRKWHVLGHSWGTVLAYEYYRKYPDPVSSLILGSPCIDVDAWAESTNQLLKNLPDSLQEVVLQADSTGIYDDPLYEVAINSFYDLYLWGKNPVKTDLDSIVMTANLSIYEYMWGPSEFSITGTLKNYNGEETIINSDVPILFTVGELDEIQPSFVEKLATQIPQAEVRVFTGASHMTPWDAPEESVIAVEEFISRVESQNE